MNLNVVRVDLFTFPIKVKSDKIVSVSHDNSSAVFDSQVNKKYMEFQINSLRFLLLQ